MDVSQGRLSRQVTSEERESCGYRERERAREEGVREG